MGNEAMRFLDFSFFGYYHLLMADMLEPRCQMGGYKRWKMDKKNTVIVGLLVLVFFIGWSGLLADVPKDDVAVKWKKLGKQRILPGIWISKSQNMVWGIHMKEIRQKMESVGFDQPVKITLVLDGGMKVNLGAYKPDEPIVGTTEVTWSAILNLVERNEDLRFTSDEIYPLQFYDADDNKRATIRVRVSRE